MIFYITAIEIDIKTEDNKYIKENLLSEVLFSHNLQTENTEQVICLKTPDVLIVVCPLPLPLHTVNLLCYVPYRTV